MSDIIVLGIHDGHGAGAALTRNGEVLAAISEERLNNRKNYSGTPIQSIKEVFKIGNIEPRDISAIAIVGLLRTVSPIEQEDDIKVRIYKRMAKYLSGKKLTKFYVKFLHKFRNMSQIRSVLEEMNINDKEIFFIEHHTAHAACALYQNPTGLDEDKLIFTLDGAGDGISSTVSIGNKDGIKRIAFSTSYHSIANNLYSEMTGYLGLKRWEHEYKLMGMAPYGRSEYCIDKVKDIVVIDKKNPLEFRNKIGAYSTYLSKKFKNRFHEQRFDNLAAATQEVFEKNVIKWVKSGIDVTGIDNIVCSGGAFLNVKVNSLLRDLNEVNDSFFYPAADDNGTVIGACLEVYRQICERDGKKPKFQPLSDLYLGREFSNEYIEKVIENSKLDNFVVKLLDEKEIPETIAALLAEQKIIARFSGKDEFGPRALGNRSIMADPRDLKVIRKINFAIKKRDFWMPFAPSILEDDMDLYLVNPRPARYMIEAFNTTEEAVNIIAACHPFDMTARPQTVNEWNPGYYKIIESFKNITDVSGILNTSFNLHGYPIVGSPEVAIYTLKNSDLDGLIMGNYLIQRK